MTDVKCPICLWDASSEGHRSSGDGRVGEKFACRRCGPFVASRELLADLAHWLEGKGEDTKRALLSHAVRKMQRENGPPFLSTRIVEEILKGSLPSPFQQADNLVLWLGTHLNGPGETLSIQSATHQSIVGSRTPAGFDFVLKYLINLGILTGTLRKHIGSVIADDATLTFEGWRYFAQLHRGAASSRKAFMAMKYGDSTLDQCVDRARDALKKTGFTLHRLDDVPKAGLIDDRLRVDIRTSRFLIADLTHENAGAYWEAGFAEGLGKPVIYTCEKSKFDRAKTHFDTNHHLTVLWSADHLSSFEEALKATIRATLPDEAILQDADSGTTEA
jgi:hypothetical protein